MDGMGLPMKKTLTKNVNPSNINPYYWVDDHPLLYGNNECFDNSTYAKS